MSAASRSAGAANLAAGARPRLARSPFRLPKQTSISNRVFR
nr:unknown [Glycine max]